MRPLISIIMPVFCTPKEILSRSLESAITQSFEDIEIIVVDDSPVENSCEAIIKPFEARDDRIVYISHDGNLGTLEARRTGVINASGKYILYFDPDDELTNETCEILYNAAKKNKANIVQCGAIINVLENIPEQRHKGLLSCEEGFTLGLLTGEEIARNCFLEGGHNKFIWSKLIDADLCRRALNEIPRVYCVLTEDLLIYFFVSIYAKRYFGIPEKLYQYNIADGISVPRREYSLEDWSKLCTCSHVFIIIISWIQTKQKRTELEDILLTMMMHEMRLGLLMLQKQISDELRPRAYEIFCEMWGEEYVKKVEKKMAGEGKKAE